MKTIKTVALLLLTLPMALFAVGCTKRIHVELASEHETIPQPSFIAREGDGEAPSYTEIRVFDVTEDCSVPECPLVWQIATRGDENAERITYGAFPSFGSLTVVAPKRLQADHRYLIILEDSQGGTDKFGRGRMQFVIDSDGSVREDG